MITPVEDLALHLLRMARQSIDAMAYEAFHQKILRRTLISWSEEPTLQEYVPRLLHYCLECGDPPPPIVLHAFRHLTGQSSTEEFRKQLQAESAVLDQLNSVPWPYGIRARRGSDTRRLAPIIPPNVPIDPSQEISRAFLTSCDRQAYARIELFAGPKTADRAESAIPLLTIRVMLPEGLPKGERVEVAIKRIGEAGMRLIVRVPSKDGTGNPWWWIEDSAGFADLAADVARTQGLRERNGPGRELKLLLLGCLRLLNRSLPVLSKEDKARLTNWMQKTSSALVQRDEDGVKNALRLLLGDLKAVPNESVAVVLETFLGATEAPQEVTTEFDRLASLLLGRKEDFGAAGDRAWTVIEDWYRTWQKSVETTSTEDERREIAEFLFAAWQIVREARSSGEIRHQMGPLLTVVKEVLGRSYSLSSELTEALAKLQDGLTRPFIGAPNTDRFSLIDLQDLLSDLFVRTGQEVLGMTVAPDVVQDSFFKLRALILTDDSPIDRTLVRAQMVQVVSAWYEVWRREPARGEEVEKDRQAEILIDLLDTLEAPELREEAVTSLMEREPLYLLREFAKTFRTSRWTRHVQSEDWELVDYHLGVIERLAIQSQQEDLYHIQDLQNLAESSELGDLRAMFKEEVLVITNPAPLVEEFAKQASPSLDVDELLEEISDGLDSEA